MSNLFKIYYSVLSAAALRNLPWAFPEDSILDQDAGELSVHAVWLGLISQNVVQTEIAKCAAHHGAKNVNVLCLRAKPFEHKRSLFLREGEWERVRKKRKKRRGLHTGGPKGAKSANVYRWPSRYP